MLEAAGISILTKAVDFLFDEGRKVLEERRERRQAEKKEAGEAPESPTAQPAEQEIVLQTKEEILRQRVNETAWKAREDEVKHLLSMMEIHYRSYRLAQEQYAKWGSVMVPQVIVFNLEEAERGLVQTMKKLQNVLQDVYDKPIALPGLAQE